jgi:hypothetical protein
LSADRIQSGETHRIWFLAKDVAGAPVTGATVTVRIRLDANSSYWTGTAFGGVTSLAMTQADAVNLPGLYFYDFAVPSSITSGLLVCLIQSATAAVVNDPEVQTLKVGGFVNYLNSSLSVIDANIDTLIPLPTLVSLLRSQILTQDANINSLIDDVKRILKSTGLRFDQ